LWFFETNPKREPLPFVSRLGFRIDRANLAGNDSGTVGVIQPRIGYIGTVEKTEAIQFASQLLFNNGHFFQRHKGYLHFSDRRQKTGPRASVLGER